MTLGELPKSRKRKPDDSGLRAPIIQIVKNAAANAPRSLQKRIGPSEMGTPCDRQLGYKLGNIKPSRGGFHDPWPSYVGTAIHAHLEETFKMENQRLISQGKPARWITERKVDVGFGITGSCDLYDTESATILDFKTLGNTTYLKYTREGPSEVYRTQAHLYGLGFVRAGFEVKQVAIAFFGRAKTLQDLHIWSEPWDINVALKALKRVQTVQEILDAGGTPRMLAANPGTACMFCDWKGCIDEGFCAGDEEE
jgi:hypothetical protein